MLEATIYICVLTILDIRDIIKLVNTIKEEDMKGLLFPFGFLLLAILVAGCALPGAIINEMGSRVQVESNLPGFSGREGVVITNTTQDLILDVIITGNYSRLFDNVGPGTVVFVPTSVWGQESIVVTLRAYKMTNEKKVYYSATSRNFYFSGASYYKDYWDVQKYDFRQ